MMQVKLPLEYNADMGQYVLCVTRYKQHIRQRVGVHIEFH